MAYQTTGTITGMDVFQAAITIMDELSDEGKYKYEDTDEYRQRTLAILNVLVNELYPFSDTYQLNQEWGKRRRPVAERLEDLYTELDLDNYCAGTVLPYGLAAHLLLTACITIFCLEPVLLGISLACAIAYYLMRNGRCHAAFHIGALGMPLLFALLNPLWNQHGETVLFIINQRAITQEALFYGGVTGLRLAAVFYWFRNFSDLMTSEKLFYLFRGFSPKLALIFTMAVRNLSLFRAQAKKIQTAQRALGLYRDGHLIDDLRGCVGPKTAVVSLQNGLGNDELLCRYFPPEQILYGFGTIGTELPEPGKCVSKPESGVIMRFGAAKKDAFSARMGLELERCFRAGCCEAVFEEDVRPYVWKKAISNSGYNTLSALLRLQVGDYLEEDAGIELLRSVWAEGCAVCRAVTGLDLWPELQEELPRLKSGFATYYPSMAQDVLIHHRQTEILLLNGAISRYGAACGIPTPLNDALTRMILCIQSSYEKQYRDEPKSH